MTTNNTAGADGSSPRTWGTRERILRCTRRTRFIPTHVGNAPVPRRSSISTPVHPHARGERALLKTISGVIPGSSPRTWGTRPVCRDGAGAGRFIPTHVGNAPSLSFLGSPDPVHPHARGERAARKQFGIVHVGSSPRTWGTHEQIGQSLTDQRFIPTHVGNAGRGGAAAIRHTVHPHARGEREVTPEAINHRDGSSPRTWGTPNEHLWTIFLNRFIPTHVGNATSLSRWCRRRTVHPHARGERHRNNDQRRS